MKNVLLGAPIFETWRLLPRYGGGSPSSGAVATECGLMLVLIALASCFGGGWVIAWNRCRRERFIDLGSLLCP